jgi:hypothetical protein
MRPQQAHFWDSVPALTSYTPVQRGTSDEPSSVAHFAESSWPAWLTHERACLALIRAARRSGRPLAAVPLAREAGIWHIVGEPGIRDLLAELCFAGELCTGIEGDCLLDGVRVYWAPKGGRP